MQQVDTLIRTKLRLPFIRQALVPRSRLKARMAEGLRRPLMLITAPAGFGKTTLVASAVATTGMPVAWLSLDRDDNETGRFLKYLVAALQTVDPAIGQTAAQLVAGSQPAPADAVITSLINDLDGMSGDVILVLDDYQFISSPAVHEVVGFLLEHCPAQLHLVVATRSDPPLPVARLRARGQMVELRAADLAFTEGEAAAFLNDVMGLDLEAEAVEVLERRTEGWIAGLQMAALSMQGREDVGGFIAAFAGTHRFIMDFMLEEVLAREPEEVQRFLLRTSVLNRLSGPLCDAVTGGSESQGMLERLERRNLFLIPLDDERQWYRYHHLFADLLQARLRNSLDTQAVAQLHIRAAEWYRDHGFILAAIDHASAAGDEKRVELLIEESYLELVRRGEQAWLRAWVGKLSAEQVYSRPRLCIYEAYSHSWFGELDEADRLLTKAEEQMRFDVSDSRTLAMQGLRDYVKSRVIAMRGDIDRAIELCLAAREKIPEGNLALQLDTRITLGYEYFLIEDYVNAEPILHETIQLGTASGAVINTVAAACLLARLYAVQGMLRKSYATYCRSFHVIPEASGEHLGARALIEVGCAEVLYEWNDLEAALDHLTEGLASIRMWDKADDLALTYVTLARIHLARRDGRAAEGTLDKADHLLQTRSAFPEARTAVTTTRTRLWLAQGDLAAASRWDDSLKHAFDSDDASGSEHELIQIGRARVWIALKRSDAAVALLSSLEARARSAGRIGRVIEILVLKALAVQEMGDSDRAYAALAASLTLAEPEGYVRVFLDEGEPMKMLLAQWLARAEVGEPKSDDLRTYASRLLAHFDTEPGAGLAERDARSPVRPVHEPTSLVEPLTERELEILHLIAVGSTNKEIAKQLFIAVGTVKAHTSSIYGKLGVANRTEAVAHARQLGILP